MSNASPTLTLTDIARLAGVSRPVVSMWRKRPRTRGEVVPFPEPAFTAAGADHFHRDVVVDYLRRTGRGNNPEAALDAPAAALPHGVAADELMSLLCLRVIGEVQLAELSPGGLRELAAETDPSDERVRSEIDALSTDALESRAFIDELFEASYGASDALARLHGGRVARELGVRGLNADGRGLIEVIVSALAASLDAERPRIADCSAGRSTLVVDINFRSPSGSRFEVEMPSEPEYRRLRQICDLKGLTSVFEDGSPKVVLVECLRLETREALERINNVQLDLPENSLAVAIGAAAALCDPIRDRSLDQIRDDILRTGRLRMALRSPRGLWVEAHRQALGIWVFGGQSSRPIAERRLAMADLCDLPVRNLDLQDLATDAVAALSEEDRHSFRYARRLQTARVVTAKSVVTPGVRALPINLNQAVDTAGGIERLAESLDQLIPPSLLSVQPTGTSSQVRFVTLGELKDRRVVSLRRGCRLDARRATDDGTVRTLGPAGMNTLAFDPLDLAEFAPAATRTEPGDIVFTDKPPAAVMDEAGGHLVAYPARVLRLTSKAPIGPRTLVEVINLQPESAREWTAWRVPEFTPTQRDQVESALKDLARTKVALTRRLASADQLTQTLIQGVAAGAITIITGSNPTSTKGA